MNDKRPRHYFDEIVAMPEPDWPSALETVPERDRAVVAHYLDDARRKRAWLVRKYAKPILAMSGKARLAERRALLAAVPPFLRGDVQQYVIANFNRSRR